MKKAFLIFTLFNSVLFSQSLDTSVFRYYPLSVGNRWVWYVNQNFAPGPYYSSKKIIRTLLTNSHVYYVSQNDKRYVLGGQESVVNYMRIDSLNGNMYSYDSVSHVECLMDSLNSRRGDSALTSCGNSWYRNDTLTYSIFGNAYKSKKFSWSNYFEASGYHIYSINTGFVYSFGQAVMSQTIINLLGCLINGQLRGDTSIILGISRISSEVPKMFALSQNYPNPFNPKTVIKFQVASDKFVKLIVYNALGKEVATLVSQQLSPGTYETDWDGTNYPSGVYFYQLTANDELIATMKMILIK